MDGGDDLFRSIEHQDGEAVGRPDPQGHPFFVRDDGIVRGGIGEGPGILIVNQHLGAVDLPQGEELPPGDTEGRTQRLFSLSGFGTEGVFGPAKVGELKIGDAVFFFYF